MKKPPAPPSPPAAVRCPACGAMLALTAALRRRKVQCPKCREVITLPDTSPEPAAAAPEAPAPTPVAAKPDDPRLAAIEARLAALERALEMMQATPPEPPAPPPAARSGPPPLDGAGDYDLPRFRTWGSASKREPKLEPVTAVVAVKPAVPIDPMIAEAMIEILSEAAPNKAAFWAREGDPEALEFAEGLADVFTRAGWTVTELAPHPLPPEERHLSLRMSASRSEPKVITTIHRAFGAAGFALAFEIDPERASNVPVVVLPRRPIAGEPEMRKAVHRHGVGDEQAGSVLP